MGQVYARINGIDLYKEALSPVEWNSLVDSDADFIPVPVTEEWKSEFPGMHLVAISFETSDRDHAGGCAVAAPAAPIDLSPEAVLAMPGKAALVEAVGAAKAAREGGCVCTDAVDGPFASTCPYHRRRATRPEPTGRCEDDDAHWCALHCPLESSPAGMAGGNCAGEVGPCCEDHCDGEGL